MARHNINISEEVWQLAAASGNASAYIENAVRAKYLREVQDEANAVVAALPQSEIDDWMAWGASILDHSTEDNR
ncbi:hypothetical protein [Glycomyces albidus]|jgi:hypothetical protein|uniref:CopG family transcriptional regulator n=1 Tax=Glycomyces albidus TaxID=2656774 RepID=A0A6L5GGN6_9ACTN|nr:hypothetical protein [Glycomyces albidus]MQM28867.1 hypothetical protein [Glycomyces albidus]